MTIENDGVPMPRRLDAHWLALVRAGVAEQRAVLVDEARVVEPPSKSPAIIVARPGSPGSSTSGA